jgi:hypothetical protein
MQLIFAVHHWQILNKELQCNLIFDDQGSMGTQILSHWNGFKDQIDPNRVLPDSTPRDWIELLRLPNTLSE